MRILGFDPGASHTGWCLLVDGSPVRWGELSTWKRLGELIHAAVPDIVVAEDYRLYPSKARAQSGSQLYAVRTLGVIEYICQLHDLPFTVQMASRIRKDPLVRNVKVSSNKHENDAYKHALAYWHKLKGSYDAPRNTA